MSMFRLAWRNIVYRPLTTALTLILFATGLAIMILLVAVGDQLNEKYVQNRAGVDMVVGAKGGRLQLILSSIYHLDNPVGNITIKEATMLFRDPRVEVIPLALGDNYEGYRIVGTDTSYTSLYNAELAEGTFWSKDFEVTIGSLVAEELGLEMGDEFSGAHGLGHEGHVHDEYKYKVVGILAPGGTVIDQLILTNVSSVWAVHDEHGHDHGSHDHGSHDHGDHAGHDHGVHAGHNHNDHGHEHDAETPAHDTHAHADSTETTHDHAHGAALAGVPVHVKSDTTASASRPRRQLKTHYLLQHPDKEITALLVRFKGSNAILLQGMIEEQTELMTAMPEIETQRLFSIIEPGVYYVEMLARLIVLISGLSVFISLFRSLNERRYEIALMRVNGATQLHIVFMVLTEGLVLSLLGFVSAFLLSHAILFGISSYLTQHYHYQFDALYFSAQELNALYLALGIGFAASVLPALRAVRVNITKTLIER